MHAVKACRGVEIYFHLFVTSAIDGGDWSARQIQKKQIRCQDVSVKLHEYTNLYDVKEF